MKRLSNARTLCLLAALTLPLQAREIEPSRGVHPDVDYESLTQFGPWDDRNYELTPADLDYLAPNEAELQELIPAFFRVLIRKKWKEETGQDLPRMGPAQYPRSAAQIFREKCGGFLIDGRIYNGIKVEEGRYVVIEENGHPVEKFGQGKECLQPDSSQD